MLHEKYGTFLQSSSGICFALVLDSINFALLKYFLFHCHLTIYRNASYWLTSFLLSPSLEDPVPADIIIGYSVRRFINRKTIDSNTLQASYTYGNIKECDMHYYKRCHRTGKCV